jgi:hypothetical protein
MMARVKFDPSRAARGFKKRVNKATNDKKLQRNIGDTITDRVKSKARAGNPLNTPGRFPKLKPSTIAARRRLKGKKHPAFSPATSNLTITGQLIDAVNFKRVSGGLFEIFIDKSKRTKSGEPNNRQLAGFLEKRRFTIFSKKGLLRDKTILRSIKKLLRKTLRKKLKVDKQ